MRIVRHQKETVWAEFTWLQIRSFDVLLRMFGFIKMYCLTLRAAVSFLTMLYCMELGL